MPNFYLHDSRVTGETPRCDIPVLVHPTDDLRTKVEELARQIERTYSEPAWNHTLHILCHGTSQGLQLGTSYATQTNVHLLFAPLHSKVGSVEIYGCSAALSYNRGTPPVGPYDGEAFCRGLARTMESNVSASDAVQGYLSSNSVTNNSRTIQMARWQGNVFTWNAHGQRSGVSTPAQRN